MNIEILFALRALKTISDICAQQNLQQKRLQSNPVRRFASTRLEKSAFCRLLFLCDLARLLAQRICRAQQTGTDPRLLYIASTENQYRQIEFLQTKVFPDEDFKAVDLRDKGKLSLASLQFIPDLLASILTSLKTLPVLGMRSKPIDQFNNILFMLHYTFALRFLKQKQKRGCAMVLVANDHSVVPLSFACAARSLGLKTAYIQHAHVTIDMPRLRFDIAILDGQSALDVYKRVSSSITSTIMFRGMEGKERPMDCDKLRDQGESLNVGVFLNIFEEDKLKAILTTLKQNPRIKSILLRGHPAHPITLNLNDEHIIISPAGRSLWEDAAQCDVIIGGNSGFHLLALKYGVACIFYDDLDYINYDDYGFVREGVLYEAQNLESFDFSIIKDFYLDPQWAVTFKKFDAGYREEKEDLYKRIRQNMLKSLEKTS